MIQLFWAAVSGRTRCFARTVSTVSICVLAASFAPGCATTETPGAGPNANASATVAPIPPGKARLVLSRTNDMLYMGALAQVKINGAEVASLWRSESSTVPIAPGAVAVSVSTWSYPGSWTVNLNAKAGETYALEISPRGETMFAMGAIGVAGAIVDANANRNGGIFQMRVVSAH